MESVHSRTEGLCGRCKRRLPAERVIRDDRVLLRKTCPDHGREEVVIASDANWFLQTLAYQPALRPPPRVMREVERGCPFDCGACRAHEMKVFLPVIPITSACNLDCPICYTINKNKEPYRMSLEELRAILGHLVADHGEIDIINFTGGEPTLHPDLPAILAMCAEAGIRRITVSTNGIRLLKDEALLRAFKDVDARVVLSFDSLRPETDKAMIGANMVRLKRELLDRLEACDIDTTLIPVLAADYNEAELGDLLAVALEKPNILSLEIHTITFTGQGGAGFDRRGRMTIPDVQRGLERATGGRIRGTDFIPSGCAHPLCYSICHLLRLADGRYLPFRRFLPPETIYRLQSERLYLQPGPALEGAVREAMDAIWAGAAAVDGAEPEELLGTLRDLLGQLFPPRGLAERQRQKIGERSGKAIYIHSHMDEENFDVERVKQCCVGVPGPDGSNIPTCSYNVLYREGDPRFDDGFSRHPTRWKREERERAREREGEREGLLQIQGSIR